MNIYAIFSYPTNGRDFDQEEACKALIPGEKYQLQNAFVGVAAIPKCCCGTLPGTSTR